MGKMPLPDGKGWIEESWTENKGGTDVEVKAAEEGGCLDVAARCSKERGVIVVANAMHSSTT
jgi:hypothetical protein